MMWHKSTRNILLATAFASLWVSGCGSKSAANQVLVSVLGSFQVMVPTQSQTLTASVTGATDVTAVFTCGYTTTPNPTTAVPAPKPSASAACDTAKIPVGDPDAGTPAVGTLTPVASTSTTVASTATFLAPKDFPNQKTFPNVIVMITATANADKKKTGTFSLAFDSGIRIRLSPATATLGTVESKQFLAFDFNSLVVPPDQLTWAVTFETTAKTSSVSCSGGSNDCGSIDQTTGTYKAPAAVPTAAPASTTTPVNAAGIVTLYAFSKVDNARIAQATVTVVKAGDITFTDVSPKVVAQGSLQQDIFLAATNATSQIGVTLDPTDAVCTQVSKNITQHYITVDPAQIKVVFAAGAATSSTGVRVRLNTKLLPDQLKAVGYYQVQVFSSNPSVKVNPTNPNATSCLKIEPVRPTIVSTSPDNFQESTLGQTGGVPFIIDGGFFGPADAPTVAANFDGQALLVNPSASSARRINSLLPAPASGGHFAGLFPVSVTYTLTPPAPFVVPTPASAFSNVAVIPDYGASNAPSSLGNVTLAAASKPSGIAIDSVLGLAVVTLADMNTPGTGTPGPTINTAANVQFLNLAGSGPTSAGVFSSQGFLATGVAIDDKLTDTLGNPAHVAAVVNYASRTLSILSVPAGTLLGTVDLSCVIPQTDPACKVVPEPFPYSVGIDPISHRALVAFASTNVGLIVNLDPHVTPACLPPAMASVSKYCPIAHVTLNSGATPQVAFEPSARLAYVTPGGAGLLSAVNLANPAVPPVDVSSATRASNVVTVTTTTAHSLVPGNPGTVLISGLPVGKPNGTDFNGSFSVGDVLDATHFRYFQAASDDTSTCSATCKASSGIPFLTYSISSSIAGIAINPLTQQAVLADPNARFSQITYIDSRSQSVSSTTLFEGQTGSVSTGIPEIGAARAAFQPFTNTAVSFNPNRNEVSLLDPSASQRLAIIPTGQTGPATASFTPPGTGSTAITVNLSGALAVDSINNLALAVNSGSSNISVVKLGTIKTVHIERVLTPAIDDASFGTPANLSPAAKITSGAAPKAVGPVRILGSGFNAASVQVRLDGVNVSTLGAAVTIVGNQEIDVTFPPTIPGANPAVPVFPAARHYALDVVTSAPAGLNNSNVVDFTVVEEILLDPCNVTTTTPPTSTPAAPGGVAIDEVHNLALVTSMGCHQVSVISLDPANNFGAILKAIQTGGTPTGVAVLPRLAITGQPPGTSGVAVVTNNSANTVTILDLVTLLPVAGVTDPGVGTAPSGVAINQETNLAVIANTGSSTVSTLDLTPLTKSPIGTLAPSAVNVDPFPIAVAIDPDRGTNGRGLAVVTCLLSNGSGALDGVDIGGTTPVRLSSAGVQPTPTGIVFDPAVSPALFYVTSTQGNQITAFNPDTNGTSAIKVGINPTAIAYNFQTGTMLTVNALSNTISIVDSQTFRTKATLGIGGTSRFSAAIHTLTNLAVIADQANNRVLLFPLPK